MTSKPDPTFTTSTARATGRDSQRVLYEYYCEQLTGRDHPMLVADESTNLSMIRAIEDSWIEFEDSRVALRDLPATAADFRPWFDAMTSDFNQKVHELFEHLRRTADHHDVARFTCRLGEVDDHFVDLVALAQLGLDHDQKLVAAENYWDEMGNGSLAGVHRRLLNEAMVAAKPILGDAPELERPLVESIRNSNLLLLYGLRRRFVARLLGSLGIQEVSGSWRYAAVAEAVDRLSLPDAMRTYYTVHAQCDDGHGEMWLDRLLVPLVTADKSMLREVSLGIATHCRLAVEHIQAIVAEMYVLGKSRSAATSPGVA